MSEAQQITPTANATPQGGPLTDHGGRTVQSPTVWVAIVNGAPVPANFKQFCNELVSAGYYISPDGSDTTQGTLGWYGNATSGLTGIQAQAALAAWVDQWLTQSNNIQPDPNRLIVLVCPATLQISGTCTQFCGFHSRTPGGHYYAYIADPSCSGCHGGLNPNDARQMVTAHEYGEWRSDPDGDAWYSDSSGEEDGDECAWQPVLYGPWTVQGLWSGGACTVGPYQPGGKPPPPKATITTITAGLSDGTTRQLYP